MSDTTIQLIVGTLIGLGAGYVGSFMVLKKMSLVGDALSHVALPGIAVALLFKINPFIGAFAALFLAIVGIWLLEKRTTLSSETLVGIFFTLSLAIGILITPKPELLEALFGDISKIRLADLWISLSLIIVIFAIMRNISKGVILGIISKDLTQSTGVKIHAVNFVFLLLVAVIVSLGLKIAGTLLMGSLVIIPAAAAKNIALSMNHYSFSSAAFGAFSALIGIVIASVFQLPPGPIVVVTSGFIFLTTLALKRTA